MIGKKLRIGKILATALLLAGIMGLLFGMTAFAAETGNVALTVRQAFGDAGASAPNDTFDYRLAPKLASNPMPAGSGSGGYTFAVTGTDEIEIGPIDFAQPGVYTYELGCITPAAAGYTLDRQVYRIDVHVKNNLTTAVVVYKNDGAKASDIYFGHLYTIKPSDPALMADPSVVKTVSGDPAVASTFVFQLKAENSSNPMPQGSQNGVKTISIAGSGWGEFGTWSYTREGTYYYTVSELMTNIPGYTYDTAVYTITDTVKAVDGQLVLSRIVTNSANRQVTSFTYLNTYRGQGGPSTTQPPPTQPVTTQPTTEPVTRFPTQPPTEVTRPSTQPPATEPATQPTAESSTETVPPFTQAPTTEPPTMQPTAEQPTEQPVAPTRPPPPPPVLDDDGNETGVWVYDEETGEWVLELFPPLAGFAPGDDDNDKLGSGGGIMNNIGGGSSGGGNNSGNSNNGGGGYYPPSQNGPKTGDESQSALYTVLFCLSAITATISAVYLAGGRRRRKEAEA